MAQVTGTMDISTLLAARFQSAAEFGLSTIERILAADIAAHNAIVTEMVGEMCELTTDRQRIYGSSLGGDMNEVDEYGRGPSQKSNPGSTVAFPLKAFQFNIGWNDKFLRTATPADLAIMVQAAEKAHLREIQRQIKKAIFGATNYTVRDHLVDNVSLDVKRFVNADSANIPDGPNGETFAGASHTHYTAYGSWDAAQLLAAINSLVEHGHGGNVKLAINTADESTVRGLSGFTAYQDPRLVFGASTTGIPGTRLDITRLDNRAIGIFGAAEVWVKPWTADNYAFCWDASDPMKPLAFRQRGQTSLQGLRIAAENSDYPLFARFLEAEMGVGVWTRTNGVCHYAGNSSWADMTIA